jgi:hypothetical protein
MERFPGPSLSVVADPWIASDGGFSGVILRGSPLIYGISKQLICKIQKLSVVTSIEMIKFSSERDNLFRIDGKLCNVH